MQGCARPAPGTRPAAPARSAAGARGRHGWWVGQLRQRDVCVGRQRRTCAQADVNGCSRCPPACRHRSSAQEQRTRAHVLSRWWQRVLPACQHPPTPCRRRHRPQCKKARVCAHTHTHRCKHGQPCVPATPPAAPRLACLAAQHRTRCPLRSRAEHDTASRCLPGRVPAPQPAGWCGK